MPTDMAAQPESTTIYFLLANSSAISATSSAPSGKFEQPTMAMTPGMVPSTIGAPTFAISVSIMGPRPTRSLPVSQLAAACIILKMGTCRGHSCSHFPQPMHLLNTSTRGWRFPFFAASIESPHLKQVRACLAAHIAQLMVLAKSRDFFGFGQGLSSSAPVPGRL